MTRALVATMCLAWPFACGASSSFYTPPSVIVTGTGAAITVAQVDQGGHRWLSLCRQDASGTLESDVRGLDRFGVLFDSRLSWENSAGFKPGGVPARAPGDEGGDDETVVTSMRSISVGSIGFHTAQARPDGTGTDYWNVAVTVRHEDGVLQPISRVVATPADRRGVPVAGVASEIIEIAVKRHADGFCEIPELRAGR